MKKKLITLVMLVLLLAFGLSLSSCFSLVSAISRDANYASALNREASMSNNDANWRSELSYNTYSNNDLDTAGAWYGSNIPGWTTSDWINFQNLSSTGKYKGVSPLNILMYGDVYALVSADDRPAGEESSFTLKVLGNSYGVTYTVRYILAADGNSFRIIDLGGINNHPLLKIGTYTRRNDTSGSNVAPEGYGQLSVCNMNSNLNINMIIVKGVSDISYSRSYQVNISPRSGILPGGSFELGDVISGKKYLPIGDYEITVHWSNGAQSSARTSVSNRGGILNLVNP